MLSLVLKRVRLQNCYFHLCLYLQELLMGVICVFVKGRPAGREGLVTKENFIHNFTIWLYFICRNVFNIFI